VTPLTNSTNTFEVAMPIQAGDSIGVNCCQMGDHQIFRATAGTQQTWGTVGAPLADGEPPRAPDSSSNIQLMINADIEPDCDADGLGDETQDGNISSCASGATPLTSTPLTCKGQRVTIVGTDGPEVIVGTPGDDVIAGLGGNDKISGLSGKDTICGGSGNDKLKGGGGNDKLLGQKGKDTLKGGPGKDKLVGGPGKDKQIQ